MFADGAMRDGKVAESGGEIAAGDFDLSGLSAAAEREAIDKSDGSYTGNGGETLEGLLEGGIEFLARRVPGIGVTKGDDSVGVKAQRCA